MHGAPKKIETAANVAIIVVALVAGSALIKRYFLAGPPRSEEPVSAPGQAADNWDQTESGRCGLDKEQADFASRSVKRLPLLQ
jgi:hypothetical protein